jgi:hypothetical protein
VSARPKANSHSGALAATLRRDSLRLTCQVNRLALSSLGTLLGIFIRIATTTTTTPPSTGKALIAEEAFVAIDHGKIPLPVSVQCRSSKPSGEG